ncbi:hypothetical protein [Herbiconiux solani]|uniref:hypothetical protein n=1 Tax=Herbiconiux solani TaxID=661329 RepID=UPI0012ECD488|nr:hypothetical protein [Herbiconiux solani]
MARRDDIVHRLGEGLSVSARTHVRVVAAASVSSWWVIVGAFMVSPMVVVLLVALVTRP